MKIKDIFEIEKIEDKQFMVCLDSSIFAGMIELNETAAFIINCFKEDSSINDVAKKLSSEYEVTEEEAIIGIEQIVSQLEEIDAIEE